MSKRDCICMNESSICMQYEDPNADTSVCSSTCKRVCVCVCLVRDRDTETVSVIGVSECLVLLAVSHM